ncbi:type II secretion system F family protein [Natronosalvus halobius]|uniref:type II secretion system F family protein n=1 Tax=Natronosalvus halobius TaxID=2953746 RepID=UPI00209EE991|nr:type II secretion system F family protein [Natronosalvus halobius]USZ72963.1 type II secretion system F family protein [Natronosalvus halobius]
MTRANFLPLAFAVVLCSPILLAAVNRGVDTLLARTADRLFGPYVEEFRSEHPGRQDALRAAHIPTTYREYGAKSLLYAGLLAVVGSILGIYVSWGLLLVLSIEPAVMREQLPGALSFLANVAGIPTLSALELFGLLLVSCLTLGVLAGVGTYWFRWWYPGYVADNRARRIEYTLPSTVAFIYALSQSGMEFPTVVRIVAAHDDTYGEAASEFRVAVRNMDTFGTDVITALQTMSRRSPSPQFREFSENLISVLKSGHSLSSFLERQYHDYQEESESQQERMLDLLGTLAESYVTVLVAGPLFLITILFVIGISVGDTLGPLQVLIYVILPFGNLAFIVYLSMVTDSVNPGRTIDEGDVDDPGPYQQALARTDGGLQNDTSPNVERIHIYRRLRAVRERLGSPLETLLDRPARSLLVTGPIALGLIAWRLPEATTKAGIDAAVIDDVLVVAGLLVGTTFAVLYAIHRRRIDAVEAAIPDFLDRLASVNEAGVALVSAIGRLRDSDLGALDVELERIWADVQWGAELETALVRFGIRVRTRAASRVVTLLTEAMNASGNLATVLRIAARQAAADRRLKRARQQAMLEYMVVVYISFLVFLFIIAVLAGYMLPTLQAAAVEGGSESLESSQVDGLSGLDNVDAATYTLLFYHATLIQGALSGLIAGQLSTGDVKAGVKHAVAMVALSFVLFAVVI